MIDWNAYRSHYPALAKYVYADNAAVGAIPKSAADEAKAVLDDMVEDGMLAYVARKSGLGEVRSAVGEVLGAPASSIGFTDSTSTSMNLLAMMAAQEWQTSSVRRDQFVVLRDEFPSSTLGWLHQGFEPVWVEPEEDGTYPPEKVAAAIGPRCRAVLTSEVQFKTGVLVDVAAIKSLIPERDILHIVNATQSAGVVPQQVVDDGFSAVTVSSVKWLCVGVGTGTVYLSEQMREQCKIPVVGWMSQADPFAMKNDAVAITPDASAVETGAVELSRLYALKKCAEIVTEIGVPVIRERVLEINRRLMDGLQAQGAKIITPDDDARRSGIVTVQRDNAAEFRDWTVTQKLLISLRGADLIRFSLHFFNNQDDVDQLLTAWKQGPK